MAQKLAIEYKNKIDKLQKENQELKEEFITTLKKNNETLKNEINKIDKLKKAIEILKNKKVNIDLLLNSSECCSYNFYAKKQDLEDLTQEEYDLLKEVLENEN